MISILLSSRSHIHSSVLFSFLIVVLSLVFILALVFSNSDWLLFIVPFFLLQWSTFPSIAFLNPFSIFITLFWTQGLVDWKGLFHCFFQGIFLFFYWGTSSPSLIFLYFSDSELRKNSYLLWSWRAVFIWESNILNILILININILIFACLSLIFLVQGLFLVWMLAMSFP